MYSFSELHFLHQGFIVCVAVVVVIKVVLYFANKALVRGILADDPTDPKYDKEKIYLHVFPRGTIKNIPNASPYVMKMETWLRMNNFEYEAVETMAMSRTTKQIPYIFHRGKERTDSNLIIEYLEKEFEIDSSEGLSLEYQTISRAFTKMIDDSTFWTFVAHKTIHDSENTKKMVDIPVPKVFKSTALNWFFKNTARRVKVVGTGRKPAEEVYRIGNEDLRAISLYLGDKKFLMGDRMTKVDCAIFGHLCGGVYNGAPSPFTKFLKEECKNMAPYMTRIKEKCWPDWDKYSNITFGVDN